MLVYKNSPGPFSQNEAKRDFLAKHGFNSNVPLSFLDNTEDINDSHHRETTIPFTPKDDERIINNNTKEPTDEEITQMADEYAKTEAKLDEAYEKEEFIEDYHLEKTFEEDEDKEFPKRIITTKGLFSIIGGTEVLHGDASRREVKAFCEQHKNFAIVFDTWSILFYFSLLPIKLSSKNIITNNKSNMDTEDKPGTSEAIIASAQPTANLLIIN